MTKTDIDLLTAIWQKLDKDPAFALHIAQALHSWCVTDTAANFVAKQGVQDRAKDDVCAAYIEGSNDCYRAFGDTYRSKFIVRVRGDSVDVGLDDRDQNPL